MGSGCSNIRDVADSSHLQLSPRPEHAQNTNNEEVFGGEEGRPKPSQRQPGAAGSKYSSPANNAADGNNNPAQARSPPPVSPSTASDSTKTKWFDQQTGKRVIPTFSAMSDFIGDGSSGENMPLPPLRCISIDEAEERAPCYWLPTRELIMEGYEELSAKNGKLPSGLRGPLSAMEFGFVTVFSNEPILPPTDDKDPTNTYNPSPTKDAATPTAASKVTRSFSLGSGGPGTLVLSPTSQQDQAKSLATPTTTTTTTNNLPSHSPSAAAFIFDYRVATLASKIAHVIERHGKQVRADEDDFTARCREHIRFAFRTAAAQSPLNSNSKVTPSHQTAVALSEELQHPLLMSSSCSPAVAGSGAALAKSGGGVGKKATTTHSMSRSAAAIAAAAEFSSDASLSSPLVKNSGSPASLNNSISAAKAAEEALKQKLRVTIMADIKKMNEQKAERSRKAVAEILAIIDELVVVAQGLMSYVTAGGVAYLSAGNSGGGFTESSNAIRHGSADHNNGGYQFPSGTAQMASSIPSSDSAPDPKKSAIDAPPPGGAARDILLGALHAPMAAAKKGSILSILTPTPYSPHKESKVSAVATESSNATAGIWTLAPIVTTTTEGGTFNLANNNNSLNHPNPLPTNNTTVGSNGSGGGAGAPALGATAAGGISATHTSTSGVLFPQAQVSLFRPSDSSSSTSLNNASSAANPLHHHSHAGQQQGVLLIIPKIRVHVGSNHPNQVAPTIASDYGLVNDASSSPIVPKIAHAYTTGGVRLKSIISLEQGPYIPTFIQTHYLNTNNNSNASGGGAGPTNTSEAGPMLFSEGGDSSRGIMVGGGGARSGALRSVPLPAHAFLNYYHLPFMTFDETFGATNSVSNSVGSPTGVINGSGSVANCITQLRKSIAQLAAADDLFNAIHKIKTQMHEEIRRQWVDAAEALEAASHAATTTNPKQQFAVLSSNLDSDTTSSSRRISTISLESFIHRDGPLDGPRNGLKHIWSLKELLEGLLVLFPDAIELYERLEAVGGCISVSVALATPPVEEEVTTVNVATHPTAGVPKHPLQPLTRNNLSSHTDILTLPSSSHNKLPTFFGGIGHNTSSESPSGILGDGLGGGVLGRTRSDQMGRFGGAVGGVGIADGTESSFNGEITSLTGVKTSVMNTADQSFAPSVPSTALTCKTPQLPGGELLLLGGDRITPTPTNAAKVTSSASFGGLLGALLGKGQQHPQQLNPQQLSSGASTTLGVPTTTASSAPPQPSFRQLHIDIPFILPTLVRSNKRLWGFHIPELRAAELLLAADANFSPPFDFGDEVSIAAASAKAAPKDYETVRQRPMRNSGGSASFTAIVATSSNANGRQNSSGEVDAFVTQQLEAYQNRLKIRQFRASHRRIIATILENAFWSPSIFLEVSKRCEYNTKSLAVQLTGKSQREQSVALFEALSSKPNQTPIRKPTAGTTQSTTPSSSAPRDKDGAALGGGMVFQQAKQSHSGSGLAPTQLFGTTSYSGAHGGGMAESGFHSGVGNMVAMASEAHHAIANVVLATRTYSGASLNTLDNGSYTPASATAIRVSSGPLGTAAQMAATLPPNDMPQRQAASANNLLCSLQHQTLVLPGPHLVTHNMSLSTAENTLRLTTTTSGGLNTVLNPLAVPPFIGGSRAVPNNHQRFFTSLIGNDRTDNRCHASSGPHHHLSLVDDPTASSTSSLTSYSTGASTALPHFAYGLVDPTQHGISMYIAAAVELFASQRVADRSGKERGVQPSALAAMLPFGTILRGSGGLKSIKRKQSKSNPPMAAMADSGASSSSPVTITTAVINGVPTPYEQKLLLFLSLNNERPLQDKTGSFSLLGGESTATTPSKRSGEHARIRPLLVLPSASGLLPLIFAALAIPEAQLHHVVPIAFLVVIEQWRAFINTKGRTVRPPVQPLRLVAKDSKDTTGPSLLGGKRKKRLSAGDGPGSLSLSDTDSCDDFDDEEAVNQPTSPKSIMAQLPYLQTISVTPINVVGAGLQLQPFSILLLKRAFNLLSSIETQRMTLLRQEVEFQQRLLTGEAQRLFTELSNSNTPLPDFTDFSTNPSTADTPLSRNHPTNIFSTEGGNGNAPSSNSSQGAGKAYTFVGGPQPGANSFSGGASPATMPLADVMEMGTAAGTGGTLAVVDTTRSDADGSGVGSSRPISLTIAGIKASPHSYAVSSVPHQKGVGDHLRLARFPNHHDHGANVGVTGPLMSVLPTTSRSRGSTATVSENTVPTSRTTGSSRRGRPRLPIEYLLNKDAKGKVHLTANTLRRSRHLPDCVNETISMQLLDSLLPLTANTKCIFDNPRATLLQFQPPVGVVSPINSNVHHMLPNTLPFVTSVGTNTSTSVGFNVLHAKRGNPSAGGGLKVPPNPMSVGGSPLIPQSNGDVLPPPIDLGPAEDDDNKGAPLGPQVAHRIPSSSMSVNGAAQRLTSMVTSVPSFNLHNNNNNSFTTHANSNHLLSQYSSRQQGANGGQYFTSQHNQSTPVAGGEKVGSLGLAKGSSGATIGAAGGSSTNFNQTATEDILLNTQHLSSISNTNSMMHLLDECANGEFVAGGIIPLLRVSTQALLAHIPYVSTVIAHRRKLRKFVLSLASTTMPIPSQSSKSITSNTKGSSNINAASTSHNDTNLSQSSGGVPLSALVAKHPTMAALTSNSGPLPMTSPSGGAGDTTAAPSFTNQSHPSPTSITTMPEGNGAMNSLFPLVGTISDANAPLVTATTSPTTRTNATPHSTAADPIEVTVAEQSTVTLLRYSLLDFASVQKLVDLLTEIDEAKKMSEEYSRRKSQSGGPPPKRRGTLNTSALLEGIKGSSSSRRRLDVSRQREGSDADAEDEETEQCEAAELRAILSNNLPLLHPPTNTIAPVAPHLSDSSVTPLGGDSTTLHPQIPNTSSLGIGILKRIDDSNYSAAVFANNNDAFAYSNNALAAGGAFGASSSGLALHDMAMNSKNNNQLPPSALEPPKMESAYAVNNTANVALRQRVADRWAFIKELLEAAMVLAKGPSHRNPLHSSMSSSLSPKYDRVIIPVVSGNPSPMRQSLSPSNVPLPVVMEMGGDDPSTPQPAIQFGGGCSGLPPLALSPPQVRATSGDMPLVTSVPRSPGRSPHSPGSRAFGGSRSRSPTSAHMTPHTTTTEVTMNTLAAMLAASEVDINPLSHRESNSTNTTTATGTDAPRIPSTARTELRGSSSTELPPHPPHRDSISTNHTNSNTGNNNSNVNPSETDSQRGLSNSHDLLPAPRVGDKTRNNSVNPVLMPQPIPQNSLSHNNNSNSNNTLNGGNSSVGSFVSESLRTAEPLNPTRPSSARSNFVTRLRNTAVSNSGHGSGVGLNRSGNVSGRGLGQHFSSSTVTTHTSNESSSTNPGSSAAIAMIEQDTESVRRTLAEYRQAHSDHMQASRAVIEGGETSISEVGSSNQNRTTPNSNLHPYPPPRHPHPPSHQQEGRKGSGDGGSGGPVSGITGGSSTTTMGAGSVTAMGPFSFSTTNGHTHNTSNTLLGANMSISFAAHSGLGGTMMGSAISGAASPSEVAVLPGIPLTIEGANRSYSHYNATSNNNINNTINHPNATIETTAASSSSANGQINMPMGGPTAPDPSMAELHRMLFGNAASASSAPEHQADGDVSEGEGEGDDQDETIEGKLQSLIDAQLQ